MQLAAIDGIRRVCTDFACCYACNLTFLINADFVIDHGSAILHIQGCAFAIDHAGCPRCTIQCDFGFAIRNCVAAYGNISKLSSLIGNNAIFCCDITCRFDGAHCTADANILASDIAEKNILIQAYFICLLAILIGFFYGNIATIDDLAVLTCFGSDFMELAAIDGIGRVGSNSTCRYTANTTSIINHNFAKFCILRGNLTVIAVRISYVQFSITKSTVFIEYAIIQLYISNVATSCFDTSIFVYNKFTTSCIEGSIGVHKEWHRSIVCGCTYGQVVFCVQCIGLNGVYTGHVAFFIDGYLTKFSGFRSDLAVVAVCIAYIQLAVTQCGIFIEYAIFQNYVADFAFGCGYFAVFIYNQFAVGSIECTVAVYKERYSAVFICSTYGQVVFCVQCICLNIIDIDIFVQCHCDFGFFIAYTDIVIAREIYRASRCHISSSGSHTIGCQVPTLISSFCLTSDLF